MPSLESSFLQVLLYLYDIKLIFETNNTAPLYQVSGLVAGQLVASLWDDFKARGRKSLGNNNHNPALLDDIDQGYDTKPTREHVV